MGQGLDKILQKERLLVMKIWLILLVIPFFSTAFETAVNVNHEKEVEIEEQAQEISIWEQNTLTEAWWPRHSLEEQGISFELVYTAEVVSNLQGGIKRDTFYLDNLDFIITIDAEKLLSWHGATFSLYILSNYGEDPSEIVGDAQVTSNIEALDTVKVYEAWWQQNFLSDRISFKVGLYDLNSEFDVMEVATLFLGSSHGIGLEYAQSGEKGPSIFPDTSLAARLRIEPVTNFYMQAAVLDGVPGDPDDKNGTHIILKRSDGVLLAGEVGYLLPEEFGYGKIAVGGWYYTARFEEVLKPEKKQRGNHGAYNSCGKIHFC